ncbi:MAG: autotransporter assembly complex protein TamA [Janthinobacterium lividum]
MIVRTAGVRAALAGVVLLAAEARAQQSPAPVAAPGAGGETMAARPGIDVPWPDIAPAVAVASAEEAGGDTRYAVVVAGLEPRLLVRFRELSALWRGRSEVANLAQINRRASEDSELIDQLLRSLGYYGGKTRVAIAPPATHGAPATVALTVAPGPLYHFSSVRVSVPAGVAHGLVEGGVGVKAGDPVAAAAITAGQDGLRQYLGTRGYAFPTIAPPDIVVDHATRTAALTQAVDPGSAGRFGAVRLKGKSLLSTAQVERLARFKPGEPYTAADLDDLRRALVATGLVGGVTITPVVAGPGPDGAQVIDLTVSTEAAPLRTVAVTAGYSTSQGFRVEASWEHRDLVPPNGAVTFRGIAAEHEQLIGAELRRQNWRQRDMTLAFAVNADTATQDAFNARTLSFTTTVARETNLIWQKQWYFTAGTELALSQERDKSEAGNPERLYYIAALPFSLTYDGSNNLLDPTSGYRLTGRASPELSFQSGTFGYVKLQVEGSTYLPLSDRITLAVRGHLGSIAGASRRNIAPTRRFYAGGGGSVRGFGFQDVGPEDAQGDPRGGNSVTEASFEARFRFGDFGLVPFLDVGQVYTSTIPKFDSLRIGAGLGARYYTSFGPVRIDVATPVNPRANDAAVQFYVSIGQAF